MIFGPAHASIRFSIVAKQQPAETDRNVRWYTLRYLSDKIRGPIYATSFRTSSRVAATKKARNKLLSGVLGDIYKYISTNDDLLKLKTSTRARQTAKFADNKPTLKVSRYHAEGRANKRSPKPAIPLDTNRMVEIPL